MRVGVLVRSLLTLSRTVYCCHSILYSISYEMRHVQGIRLKTNFRFFCQQSGEHNTHGQPPADSEPIHLYSGQTFHFIIDLPLLRDPWYL